MHAFVGSIGLLAHVRHRILQLGVHTFVKYGQLANVLDLYEWEERALLQLRLTECLSEISAIFEKVDDAAIHVDEHADDSADLEFPLEQELLLLIFGELLAFVLVGWQVLEIVVFFPPLVGEDVASAQVHAPDLLLPRQILVDEEVLAAHADANARRVRLRRRQAVNSILKVVLRPLRF